MITQRSITKPTWYHRDLNCDHCGLVLSDISLGITPMRDDSDEQITTYNIGLYIRGELHGDFCSGACMREWVSKTSIA